MPLIWDLWLILSLSLPVNAHFVRFDDDYLVPPETKALFLERIFRSFGLHPDDTDIQFLKTQLKELLHCNLDVNGKKMYSSIECSLNALYATHCSLSCRVCACHPCYQ